MSNSKNIIILNKNSILKIKVPLTSQGKFRCKNRNNNFEYGVGFAPKTKNISDLSYVEWQIGYDKEIKNIEKKTTLNNYEFRAANRKNKNPYELSEIIWYICENGLISKKKFDAMINDITNVNEFLNQKFQIKMSKPNDYYFDGVYFQETTISLPTFKNIKENNEKIIHAEISLEKQQYATGVQPMLYLIIPMTTFDNWTEINNNTSKETPYGILTIDHKNKNCFLILLKLFALCSLNHKHDVLEIMKIISKNCNFKI